MVMPFRKHLRYFSTIHKICKLFMIKLLSNDFEKEFPHML